MPNANSPSSLPDTILILSPTASQLNLSIWLSKSEFSFLGSSIPESKVSRRAYSETDLYFFRSSFAGFIMAPELCGRKVVYWVNGSLDSITATPVWPNSRYSSGIVRNS